MKRLLRLPAWWQQNRLGVLWGAFVAFTVAAVAWARVTKTRSVGLILAAVAVGVVAAILFVKGCS